MNTIIKILHLEDLPTDVELIKRILKKGNLEFDIQVVEDKQNYERSLDTFCPDIILSDHSLPSFDSLGALAILKEKRLNIPFILVTSSISEEFAVLIMKQGADDYILKDRFQRLPNAILSALEKKRVETEHQRFLDELIINEALLKEQNAKLKEIAWIQSHVVRAPLARMLGLIDLIKKVPNDEEDNDELLNYLFASANELDDVIRSIVHKTEEAVKQENLIRN